MSIQTWLALAAMAVAPVAASARQDHLASPDRKSSITGYPSAFADYKRFAEDDETPDTRWRAANEQMGKLGGHAAHMKSDGTTPGAPTPQLKPANTVPKADSAVDGDADVGHGKHH